MNQDMEIRLVLEVEGILNSDDIPSSRLKAEHLVNIIRDTCYDKRQPPERDDLKPWGNRYACKPPIKEAKK